MKFHHLYLHVETLFGIDFLMLKKLMFTWFVSLYYFAIGKEIMVFCVF